MIKTILWQLAKLVCPSITLISWEKKLSAISLESTSVLKGIQTTVLKFMNVYNKDK